MIKEGKELMKECVKWVREEYGLIECIKFQIAGFVLRHFGDEQEEE